MTWKPSIAHPVAASAVCSLLVLPARLIGFEAAQAVRRTLDHIISSSDALFELATTSDAAAAIAHSAIAWSAWIAYGLVAGGLAMALTRWGARRALPWASVAMVVSVWIGVYLVVWPWDDELQFILGGRLQTGLIFGPWPHAGSVGFFAGLTLGLILAATPWRIRAAAA